MMEFYQDEFNVMRELMNDLPMFVSKQHIQQELIPGTIFATILHTALFVVCVWLLQNAKKASSKESIYETSYLITTATVNLVVGLMGAYYYVTVMEHPGTVKAMILGYRAMYPLSCLQLAKNLFSIPVGLSLIHEKAEMMFHHVAVLFVVCVASSMTSGFTYFSPVVFGLLELSSVPLAVMNYFKLNPENIAAYPQFYSNVRLVFGISFLLVRWGLSLPNLVVMLRLIFYRCITLGQDGHYVVCGIMSFTFLATFFLTILQVYWGLLIVKSVVKGAPKTTKEE